MPSAISRRSAVWFPGMAEIAGRGTSEQVWRSWNRLGALPLLDRDCCEQALVVAPHPDDEVLGAGGTLAELAACGATIAVLALTDGEASHPGASITAGELARLRVAETTEATTRLFGEAPAIERLGLPDGQLARHEETIEHALRDRLEANSWCFAPHRQDGHPDHEAAGRAAARACADVGARLIEYPIWLWHWSAPDDAAISWERAVRVRLTSAAYRRKQDAISAFATQVAPLEDGSAGRAILPPHVLARFARSDEVLFA